MAAGAFVARADNVAQEADDRFIFDTTTGTLWADGDGNGAGAAVADGKLHAISAAHGVLLAVDLDAYTAVAARRAPR